MRRLLAPLAALLACAAPRGPGPAAAPAGARAEPLVPEGFEPRPGETVSERDLTGDGRPDAWRYAIRDASGGEILVRVEKDLNGDGAVDTWERHAPDGSLERVVRDLDFDRRADETVVYEGGALARRELSSGVAGVPATVSHYEDGALVRRERDANGDGKVDYWEYWVGGEIDRIGVDADGDGRVDRWEGRREDGSAPQK